MKFEVKKVVALIIFAFTFLIGQCQVALIAGGDLVNEEERFATDVSKRFLSNNLKESSEVQLIQDYELQEIILQFRNTDDIKKTYISLDDTIYLLDGLCLNKEVKTYNVNISNWKDGRYKMYVEKKNGQMITKYFVKY